jgi:hypothetical protein
MPDSKRRTAINGLVAAALAKVAGAVADATPGTARASTEDPPMNSSLPNSAVTSSGFAETLLASGPHPSLGRHAGTFGRLIGSWAGEYRDRDADATEETGTMEVHFGWVLQGRAVQDTWIAPPRALRAGSTLKRQTYGTTVRVFHPRTEDWRAVWLNPVAGVRNDLVGRRVGDDIVQFCLPHGSAGLGADRPEKWVFSRITARSFLWHAYLLEDDGVTWRVDTQFQLQRTA